MMNFSEKYKVNGNLCLFSPDGQYLASCHQNRLKIQKTSDLKTVHTFICVDTVQNIKWAPDSKFVLCSMFTKATVQVWWLDDFKWTCKIEEGEAGLVSAQWSADSRHILTTAEFHIRITVWSLVNKSIFFIRYPKDIENGLTFDKDGRYAAVAERRDCKDHISILATDNWHLVSNFECDTKDLAGIAWSPRSSFLCLWESSIEFKVLLYAMNGHCIASYSANDSELGAKCVSWSPCGQLLAIGSYDQKVRILNDLTWQAIVEHEHGMQIKDCEVVVYQESVQKMTRLATTFSANATSRWTIVESRPVVLPTTKSDLNKPNPKVGVAKVLFSHDANYLATKNDNFQSVVWIWSILDVRLSAVLIHTQPVKCFAWNPTKTELAVSTGTSKISIWSLEGATVVPIPQQNKMDASVLKWNPQGNAILVCNKDEFCVCYVT